MRSNEHRAAWNHGLSRGLAVALAAGAMAGSSSCAPHDSLRDDAERLPLFDGRSLDGWVQRGGKAVYAVEDGCIVGRTAPNQPNSFLCTRRTFGDFELELDFRVDPELNSGVQVRSESRSEYKGGVVHGYQVEIDPSQRGWTGGLYDESRRGWLVDLKDKPGARAAFRQGEWNHLTITCRGDTFNTRLNGVPVVSDFHDSMTPEGFVALQVHGVGDRADPLTIRWKSIFIRELR